MTYQEQVLAEIAAGVELGIYARPKAAGAYRHIATPQGRAEVAEYKANGCRVSDAADLLVQLS